MTQTAEEREKRKRSLAGKALRAFAKPKSWSRGDREYYVRIGKLSAESRRKAKAALKAMRIEDFKQGDTDV